LDFVRRATGSSGDEPPRSSGGGSSARPVGVTEQIPLFAEEFVTEEGEEQVNLH